MRAAAIGALAWTPLACGDDGGSNTSDQFPTDPCFHDPQAQGCMQTTGDPTDVFPTTPCAHNPDECTSTGPDGTTTEGTTTGSSGTTMATDTDAGTDTDTDTDTDTGGSSSSGSTSTGG